MFNLSKQKYPIGIDISDLSIKLVSLYTKGDGIFVQALGRVELPQGTVQDGELKRTDIFIAKMKELIENPFYGNIDTDEVYACLPENKTFIKLIDIKKNPNNINEIIQSELENNIPLQVSEIYWDWQFIDSTPDHRHVLVGAAPRSIADQYIEVFKEAGLTIVGMELESISTSRSLMREEDPKFLQTEPTTYAVIDVGAKRTSMFIYSRNTILYSISLPISSEEATIKIADTLKIEIPQAEKAKLVCGFDADKAEGVVREILMDLINRLIVKIRDLTKFQAHHYPDFPPVTKILLAGSGVNIDKFDEVLAEKLGMPVIKGNVHINLTETKEKFQELFAVLAKDIAEKKKKKSGVYFEQDVSVNFSTAIGLALRPIFNKGNTR